MLAHGDEGFCNLLGRVVPCVLDGGACGPRVVEQTSVGLIVNGLGANRGRCRHGWMHEQPCAHVETCVHSKPWGW
jgi:hypothetical protein